MYPWKQSILAKNQAPLLYWNIKTWETKKIWTDWILRSRKINKRKDELVPLFVKTRTSCNSLFIYLDLMGNKAQLCWLDNREQKILQKKGWTAVHLLVKTGIISCNSLFIFLDLGNNEQLNWLDIIIKTVEDEMMNLLVKTRPTKASLKAVNISQETSCNPLTLYFYSLTWKTMNNSTDFGH